MRDETQGGRARRNTRIRRGRVVLCAGGVAAAGVLLSASCSTPGPSVGFGDDTDASSNGSSGGSSSGRGASSGSSGGPSSSGSGGSNGGGTGSSGSSSGQGTGSSSGSGGSSGGNSGSSGGSTAVADDGGVCAITASNVRVTEVDVGVTYVYQEIDATGGNNIGMAPLAISPIPSGGSRVGFIGNDGMVHIAQLDASDNLVAGSVFGLPAFDFQDIYADNTGGTVLVSRNAMGGGTGNCGNPANLCGTPPNPPDPCWDMYLVRFDPANANKETWATKLTTSTAALPPYSTSATGPNVLMIWWYAHNGRIVFNGTDYAAYYGVAISTSQGGCINIHQGDEMRVVNPSGTTVGGGFDIGCSHSSFERMIWDGSKFVTVCNNDAPTGGKTGRIAFAPNTTTIYPVNELNTDLGAVLQAGGGGYWIIVSDVRPGQSTTNPALDDVHLVHATTGMFDKDITLVSDTGLNDRAPHLAAYGTNRMLAAWETSTATDHLSQNDRNRKLYVQALNATTGATQGSAFNIAGVVGSRYQDFRTYPDNSVAYVAPGSTGTKIKIVRILPCP